MANYPYGSLPNQSGFGASFEDTLTTEHGDVVADLSFAPISSMSRINWPERKQSATLQAGLFIALPKSDKPPPSPGKRVISGMMASYCTANAYHRAALLQHLKRIYTGNPHLVKCFPDCLRVEYRDQHGAKAAVGRLRSASDRMVGDYGAMDGRTQGTDYTLNLVDDNFALYDSSNNDAGTSGNDDTADPWEAPQKQLDIPDDQTLPPEVYYFDYGVVVMWGLTELQHEAVLRDLRLYELERLSPGDVDVDSLGIVVNPAVQPNILDEVLTINSLKDENMRLAAAFALSQSSKLGVFEERVSVTVDRYRHLPDDLALTGKINMTRAESNMIIGELYILTSAVNLVSNVLDTPSFFWAEASDESHTIYKTLRSYLQLTRRAEKMTKRIRILGDIIGFLKSEMDAKQSAFLEWVVIVLLAIDAVLLAGEAYFQAIEA
eukprot:comp17741_c0_seq1/m.17717 comp17741_c0_seq1/g.17717  ORF comp17741_c0_seq1/g.17717 comp17741_c0_seq1/m.17717 type:complete len:435 (-) comp17741_c0_seq1:954-2258(-)